MFKSTVQILIGVALVAQLAGCFFEGHDDRWHHDHDRYYAPEHHDHDSGIDVHLHG
jgi:hypothetical protein